MKNNISKLLDENYTENIIFVGDDGQEIEYEQIAVISLENEMYAILHPLISGIESDEVLVYRIIDNGSNSELLLEENEELINEIFNEFYRLCKKEKN